MIDQNTSTEKRTLIPYIILLGILWTVVVAGSLIWNIHQTKTQFQELARKEALSMFNKDMGFRLWGTKHGGIYAPVSKDTPPSPYMAHIEERDITTPSGKELTLMNPAYMVRQLMEDYNELYGTRGHITGLVLLRPENKPDEWETQVLKRFNSEKISEVTEFTTIEGKPFLRLMRPMMMTKGCEKCHGHLGFREGDLRGDISVSVPLDEYIERQGEQNAVLYLTHSSVWVIGLLLVGFGGNRLQSTMNEVIKAEEEVRELNTGLEKHVAKRTEELSEQKERLRKMVDNAADGIIVIDEKGLIDTFNSSAQRIFGYGEDEIIGQNISLLMPSHHATHHQDYIDSYLKTGISHILDSSREVEAVRKNGEHFPLNLAVSKIRANGKTLFSAICRDLSDQKKAANELLQAKSEAEQANLAKSEFLSSMSHELRTPLNSIIGFAQLSNLDHDLSDNHKEHLSQISDAGQHLLNLINDILDLSRIETQGFSFSVENVSLKDVTQDCLMLTEQIAKKNNIRIYDDISFRELPEVRADKIRLKQVLMNLLSNAIKYNIKGGQVSLNAQLETGHIKISITDTGPGIPSDQIPEMFEPFNRLGQEASTIEGTGIGLSITQMLIEMMEGEIGVDSTLGKGSTFWVTIPIVTDTSLENSSEDGITYDLPTRPVRLFYVDDNSVNHDLLKGILKTHDNLEIISSGSAEESFVLIHDLQPDIVLLDINMPDINGTELARRLKQDQTTRHIPLVALSANNDKKTIDNALAAGCLAYLEKPLEKEKCLQVIAKALVS